MLYRENLESGVENTVESSQTRSLKNFNIFFIPNCAFVSNLFCFRQEEEPMEISNEAVDNQSRYIYHSFHIHKTTLVLDLVCFV